MTEMVKVNKRLTSAITDIIESDSNESSVKVKSVVKFIKSNKYQTIQKKVQEILQQKDQN